VDDKPRAAAACVLAAMCVIGLIDQFVRIIAEQSSLWTFHALRSAMMWALVGVWLAVSRRRLRLVRAWGLIGRSAAISVAMIVYFGALGFLPVAQVAAGLFTAPLWILLFRALAGQGIGPRRLAAVGAGFTGVMLVLAPDPSQLSPLMVAPVAAGAFYAVGALATRAWCAGEGALELSMGTFTALGLWGIGGLLVAGAGDGFLTRGWVAPTPEVWALIALQAVGSLGAVLLLTRAYQLAEASVASVFEYSVLGFGALFGWLVWGDALGTWGMVGLVLIAGAGIAVARSGRPAPPTPA
jgi:drug/metabolite transporter (DMT)-like permease